MNQSLRDTPQVPDMPGMPGMTAAPPPAKAAGKSAGAQKTPPAPAPPQTGGHQHEPSAGAASGSPAPVHVDAVPGRLAGVQTVAAAKGTLTGTIRTVGTVVTPETGVRQVTTKVAGFVEKLYVNSVGRPVRAGEPLFDLYSPELLASQEEYVHARQVAARFSASSLPEVQRGGQDLVAAARRRLELFDVPAEFLARLDETGQPQRTVTFRAPFGGYVMEKRVVEGQRVEPGMNLMTIADLSRAWVTANLYEGEAAAARVGREAKVSLPYDDTVKIAGRIDLVYPTLDAESRTLKVRFAFPNPRLVLKPGMFVNVEIDAQREPGIIVPESAVIDTGTRQVVFVQTAPGHFEPRDVRVGMRSDGKAVLRAGVREGEQVATAATFLLDSESRLRGAMK
jgi:RND family efflux transporter MFP subunit